LTIACQPAPPKLVTVEYGRERFAIRENAFLARLDQGYYRYYRIRLDDETDLISDEDLYKYGPKYAAEGRTFTSVLNAEVKQSKSFQLGHHQVVCLIAPPRGRVYMRDGQLRRGLEVLCLVQD
jgi:hypothetical protein